MILRTNFVFSSPFGEYIDCELTQSTYANGGIALLLSSPEHGPIATATVCLPGLEANELAVKDYSENEGMYSSLLGANVITAAHRYINSGFVTNIPVCYLTDGAQT